MRDQIRRRTLAQINVQTIDDGSKGLFPTHLPLTGNDFGLSSDGKGGTRVTYLPRGTTVLEQSMPVPVIAPTGSKVSLQTIFSQSFGSQLSGSDNGLGSMASRYCVLNRSQTYQMTTFSG